MQGVMVWGFMQRERSEQLRSLSSVAGVMNGFAMSSLLQLNFDDRSVPYDGPASCGYAFTLGLTARPCLCKFADPHSRCADMMIDSIFSGCGGIADPFNVDILMGAQHAYTRKPTPRRWR